MLSVVIGDVAKRLVEEGEESRESARRCKLHDVIDRRSELESFRNESIRFEVRFDL
jgi:hypothetical protein